ncbi:hypothetical protein, partial [Streptosporangium lutulentum]|uniref:hypothetical protein n=1 Tax=Streptosporangium lutulentum TaxID=1461250 RepID=UPI00363DF56F
QEAKSRLSQMLQPTTRRSRKIEARGTFIGAAARSYDHLLFDLSLPEVIGLVFTRLFICFVALWVWA